MTDLFTSQLTKLGNQLVGSYRDNLDIVDVHNKVVLYIKTAHEVNVAFQTQKYNKLNGHKDLVSNIKLQQDVMATFGALNDLIKNNPLDKFQSEVKLLLEEYAKLKPCSQVNTFERKSKTISEADQLEKEKRLQIYSKYLNIAKNYAPVNFHYSDTSKAFCSSCGNPELSGEECKRCGLVQGGEIIGETFVAVANVRKTDYQNALKKAISQLVNFTLNEENLGNHIDIIAPLVADTGLPARFIGYKIEQQLKPRLSPSDMGIKVSTQVLNKYDQLWKQVVDKAKKLGSNIVYYDSF